MYLGKLKKQHQIIWLWYEQEQDLPFPSRRVMGALRWFVKHNPYEEYNYTGDWRGHLAYCSDRMNGGRAKAILRLIKEQLRRSHVFES